MAGERVLIAEDEHVVALDIAQSLAAAGYQISAIVGSGQEAVREVARERPDLLLMDIRLGSHSDGIQTVEEIRRWHDIPVVYVTAYADRETVARAKRTDPEAFIVKPFGERELLVAVDLALDRHRRSRDLALARTELDRLAHARQERLGIVSHDLRGPLSLIQTSAELLLHLDCPPRAVRCVETILRTTARMRRMVDDLLDVTAIEKGRLALRRRDTTVASILGEVDDLRLLATLRGVELRMAADPDLHAFCDPDRVEQVLQNLLDNAISVSPQGSAVELRIERLPPGLLVLRVHDSGPGIDPELAKRLFQPFERGRAKGLGLGLYICRTIVEAHGGHIWMEPGPQGEGTTFCFTIPEWDGFRVAAGPEESPSAR